jgi:hypothetical protein
MPMILRSFSEFSHRYQLSGHRMRISCTTWRTQTRPLFQYVRPFQQSRQSIRHSTQHPDLNLVARHNPTCLDVRRFLQSRGIATLPDIWAGYKDTDQREHDHVEVLWKLLPGKAKVRGNRLKFVERAAGDDISSKGPYIVALKFMTREEKALPVPLGACSFGV